MKKILFCVICVLTCFSMVNAKTQIEYDWGKFEEYEITNANIYKGNLALFKYDDLEWKEYFDVYNDNGEYNVNMEIPDIDFSLYECGITRKFYAFSNSLISIDNFCGEYYQTIYDDEMKAIDSFELVDFMDGDFENMVGENDKYYYLGPNFFDKKTHDYYFLYDILESDPLFETFGEQCSGDNSIESETCMSMMIDLVNNNLKHTFVPPVFSLFREMQGDPNIQVIDLFVDDNGYALTFYDDTTEQFGIYFFDADANITKKLMVDSYAEPYVLFKDNYFYVFEVKEKVFKERTMSLDYYYSVTEYDYKFNKKQEFDLSALTKEDAIDLEANYGRGFWKVLSTEDGFVMITKPDMGPMLSREPDPQMDYDAIQKYSFIYDVETKESDNGSIVVDKDSSKNGEKITYTVKPKDGYKLDKVIVTDENGNQVIITDSSFTMPNSNVTIEAIFVVENPNTNVFLSVAVACVVAFVCYFFIVQKNIKVKQFE